MTGKTDVPAGRRATIGDVARHAGVSRATVSQVLGKVGRISPSTRGNVLRAMAEIGYVYNEGAADLRRGTSRTVGLLIHDIANPFYAEMTAGLTAVLEKQGFLVYLANSAESAERQDRFLNSFRQRDVAGCILCPARFTPEATLDRLAAWQLPTVVSVRDIPQSRFDFIGVDNFGGTRAAAAHLIDAGHISLAFLGGAEDSISRAERLAGFRAAMAARSLPVAPGMVISCAATLEAGCGETLRLLRQYPETTAIVCYHDVVALGALIGLQRVGRRHRDRVAVAGFDDIEASRLWSPTLTTVSITPRQLGEAAGEALLTRMTDPEAPPVVSRLPTRLVVRESSRPCCRQPGTADRRADDAPD